MQVKDVQGAAHRKQFSWASAQDVHAHDDKCFGSSLVSQELLPCMGSMQHRLMPAYALHVPSKKELGWRGPTSCRCWGGGAINHAPAHVAEGAMVDVAPRLVVKQVADTAVVARHAVCANAAVLRHRLPGAALHAHHFPHGAAVHAMSGRSFIVAKPAGRRA